MFADWLESKDGAPGGVADRRDKQVLHLRRRMTISKMRWFDAVRVTVYLCIQGGGYHRVFDVQHVQELPREQE